MCMRKTLINSKIFMVLVFILITYFVNSQADTSYSVRFNSAEIRLPGTFNFRQISVDEGLPQSQVNYIHEDKRGFLWFATQGGGVCRYDGKKFVQYEEQDGIAGQLVNCIEEDGNSNLWFGSTWGGMTYFNGIRFEIFNMQSGLLDNLVNTIRYDSVSNSLLIGGGYGLCVYDFKTFKNEIFGTSESKSVFDIQPFKNGYLLASSKGVYFKKGSDIVRVSPDEELYKKITVDTIHHLVWGIQSRGLVSFSYQSENWIEVFPFQNEPGFDPSIITCIEVNRSGDIWLGTHRKGVYFIRNNNMLHFSANEGFPLSLVETIYTDKSNRVWFGTSGDGVICFNGFAFRYYQNKNGLNLSDIFAIEKDNEGNLWVGSSTEGVFCYDGKNIQQFTISNGLPSNTTRSLLFDKKGNLWIGTKSGLVKKSGNNFTVYNSKNGLPVDHIRCLLEDKSGKIWIGTAGGGLVCYNGKDFTIYNENSNLTHNYVHCVFQDSKGDIWAGTGAGLNRLSNGKFVNFSVQHGLCNSYVGNIVEDGFGNIWVGTDKCISRFNGRKFTNYTVENGLTSGTVYLMVIDNDGNLIVGTNKGFDKIKFSAYGQIEEIRNYSKGEGFTGIECNTKAILKDDLGVLWFGTVKGIIRYDANEERTILNQPHVLLSSVKIFYDESWMKKNTDISVNWYGIPFEYDLRHDQNTISFEFDGICTTYPDNIKYSYFLEGFDKQWSPLTKTASASYSNLRPGVYKFWVRAQGASGLWSSPVTFSFVIHPAFWQTWWFGLIILGIIVYLIYYVNTLLQKSVMRHNELLEDRVSIRTNEILKQKEEKEVLLKEIHHRVKNNMQVIVSLLNIHSDYIKDPQSLALIEDSKNRIRSMALIHEKLYESRNFSRINIGEYLDTLVDDLVKTYGLNTKIKIDKEVDVVTFGFDTIIPLGLLLNEIVSNSLKYAFFGKSQGVIYFHLKSNRDKYDLIIGDDGVGIKPEQFNESNKTIGMELIRILVDQLNGTIELIEGKGTKFRIRFESIDKKRI